MMSVQEAVDILDNYGLPRSACDGVREAWQTLKAAVLAQQTNNNGSTPCRFFSRDKVCTGKSADGGNMYQSVPWCNHEPSQRAVP